jgi:ATP-dependent DNA helicase RecQ
LYEIAGIGERKAELYGQEILNAIEQFRKGARAARVESAARPVDETLRLLREGRSLEEIAQIRGRQLSTVVNAVADLLEAGEVEFQPAWVSAEKQAVIKAACARAGLERLKPVKDILPPEISYDEIRLVVAWLRREDAAAKKNVPA